MYTSSCIESNVPFIDSPLKPVESKHPVAVENNRSLSTVKHPKAACRKFAAQSSLIKAPAIPMGKQVGELHEKWTFPSDHLPIGITIDNIGIMSWNILDPAYMNWVTELDSQGINGSMISDEHYKLENSELTFREQHIIHLLIDSITSSSSPKDIISLQECSLASYNALCEQLPTSYSTLYADGNAIIYNKKIFTLQTPSSEWTQQIFSADTRTILDVTFIKDNTPYRIINGHLPGNPNGPARLEFATYLHQTFSAIGYTLAMGDMNFNEIEMKQAFNQSAFAQSLSRSPFTVIFPYPTNINPRPNLYSKAIDHFFIYGQVGYSLLNPDDVIEGTGHMVEILS